VVNDVMWQCIGLLVVEIALRGVMWMMWIVGLFSVLNI